MQAPTNQIHTREIGSLTAELVAASRALHYVEGDQPLILDDPYAISMLSGKWKFRINNPLMRKVVKYMMRNVLPIVASHLVRGRFDQDMRNAAINEGKIGQILSLGAGFDTSAWRVYPKRPLPFFEVDVPTTQAVKQQRLEQAGLKIPQGFQFVGVDFTKDVLSQKLTNAGFDPQIPSFVSWMGTTYYIKPSDVIHTLENLGNLLAPGSMICFDALINVELLSPEASAISAAMQSLVAKRGEPMVNSYSETDLRADVEATKLWRVKELASIEKQQALYFEGRSDIPKAPPLFYLIVLERI